MPMFVLRLQTQWPPEYMLDSIEFCLEILVPYAGNVLAKKLLHHVDTVLIIRDIVA